MVDTYVHNKLDITIYYDEDPQNPRDWDNVGTMICSHRNYKLGDEQLEADRFDGWDDVKQYLEKERKAVLILPLGLYDHSGITMYVGDQHDKWDGGQVGFIYCTQEDIDREWKGDKEAAEKYLRGEVEDYDKYLTGQVYGFTVVNPKTTEEIDSCWGIFDLKQAREEAEYSADLYKHPHDAAYAKDARKLHG